MGALGECPNRCRVAFRDRKHVRSELQTKRQKRPSAVLRAWSALICGGFWWWLRELDLNQRPSGYEPDELPGCSIPRYRYVD